MSQHRSPYSGPYSPPFQKQHSQHSTSTTSPRLVFSWDPYSKENDSRQLSMLAESDQEDHFVLPPAESAILGDSSAARGEREELTDFQLDAVPGPMETCDTGVYKYDEDDGMPDPLPPGSVPGTKTQPPSTMNRRSVSSPASGPAPPVTVVKRPLQPHHELPTLAQAHQPTFMAASGPLSSDVPPTNSPPPPLTLSDVMSDAAARSPYISPRLQPVMASGSGAAVAGVATPRQDGTPTSGRLHIVAQGRPNDPRKYYLDYSPPTSQTGSIFGGGNSLGNSGMGQTGFMHDSGSGAHPGIMSAPSESGALANSVGSYHSSRSASARAVGAPTVMRHSPYGTPRAQGHTSGSVSPHQMPFSLPSSVTNAPVTAAALLANVGAAQEGTRQHEMDFATVEELGRVEAEPSPFLTLMVPPPPSCRALALTVIEVRRILDLCERWVGFVEAFLRGRRDGTGEVAEPTPRLAVALDRSAPSREALVTALDTLPALPSLVTMRPRTPTAASATSAWAVVPDPQPSPFPSGTPPPLPAEIEEDQRALEAWYVETVAWWKTIYPSTRFDISEWPRSTHAAIDRLMRGPRGGPQAGGFGGHAMRGGRGRPYNNNNNMNYGYGGHRGGGGGGFYPQQSQTQNFYDPFSMEAGRVNYGSQWSVMGADAHAAQGPEAGGLFYPYGGGSSAVSGVGYTGAGRATYSGLVGGQPGGQVPRGGSGAIGSNEYGGQGMGAFNNTGAYRHGGGGGGGRFLV